jgi:phosphoglucosamine mutase
MEENIFGTDGIRGKTNTYPIDAETILKIALSTGRVMRKNAKSPKVLVGKDTRRSGYMVENALTAGFISMGWEVNLLGPVPTPAVSFLTKSLRADLGIMISASHNPYQDNGIKFFDKDGLKIDTKIEKKISKEIKNKPQLVVPSDLGRASRINDVLGRYTEFAKITIPTSLSLNGMKIVADCANGAAYKILPQILRELGAEVVSIGVTPDGFNINKDCGSTRPEKAQKTLLETSADIGICLDGDADRVLFIDEQGILANGDQVIGLLARAWSNKNALNKNTAVATVMSNLALELYLEKIGIRLIRTQVGDKNVSKCMNKEGLNLGGEQSGHLILADYSNAGDGLITSLQVLNVLRESQKKASELFNLFKPFPQSLINIDAGKCNDFEKNEQIKTSLEDVQNSLRGEGRILIRRSGTENVIRLMVEHKEKNKLQETIDTCLSILKKKS